MTKNHNEKIEFIDTIVAESARYIGYNGLSVDTELAKNQSIRGRICLLLQRISDAGKQIVE